MLAQKPHNEFPSTTILRTRKERGPLYWQKVQHGAPRPTLKDREDRLGEITVMPRDFWAHKAELLNFNQPLTENASKTLNGKSWKCHVEWGDYG